MVRGRVSRPLAGAALLVLLLGGPVGPLVLLHAGTAADTASGPPATPRPAAFEGGRAKAPASSSHCAICHGLQTFRWHLAPHVAWPGAPAPTGWVHLVAPPARVTGRLPGVPARSPPLAA
jgi:mono/diheme cytochrome c family protein